MNLDHLRYLVTAADCRSIHEAARQLMLKQQYISSVIKNLERHFDTIIFERTARGITPTANGQYLIDKAREMLKIADEMEAGYLYPDNQALAQTEEIITLFMPVHLDASRVFDAIDEFNSYFPNCVVNLISKSPSEILQALLTTPDSLSLFFTQIASEQFVQKIPDTLAFEPLESVSLALIAHKSNEKAQDYAAITIEQALKMDLVFLAPQGLAQSPIYATAVAFGTPNIRCVVDNSALLFRMLKQHHYFAIAKANIATLDDLITISFQEPLYLRLFLLTNRGAPQSYALKSFIKLLKSHQSFLGE